MVVPPPMWQSGGKSSKNSRDEGILSLLEQLSSSATHSQQLCHRVLVVFNLSLHLQCPYAELASETDPICLLERLLNTGDPGGRKLARSDFALAKKLVVTFRIRDDHLATFLFRQAMTAIRATAGQPPSSRRTSDHDGEDYHQLFTVYNQMKAADLRATVHCPKMFLSPTCTWSSTYMGLVCVSAFHRVCC